MPTCLICKHRFNDWYSFDRHLRRGTCQQASTSSASSSTLALIGSLSTRRTHELRTDDLPLLQQRELILELQVDWLHTLNRKMGLRARLQHHCVVCNQWFAKGWHLTHHGHRQHKSLFNSGLLHRNELMLQSGIGPIKWNCPYCLAVFQSANLHHCPVLLQIAVLLSAPQASSGHGFFGRSRGCEQRTLPLQRVVGTACISRSRWVRGGERFQETTNRAGGKPRYRLRHKSRPDQVTWQQIQRQTDTGHCSYIGPSLNTTRRQSEYSTHGHRIHALHAARSTRNGVSHVACSRSLEDPQNPDSQCNQQSAQIPHVEDSGRRTTDEGQAALHGRASIEASDCGSTEGGGLRRRNEVHIQEVGRGYQDHDCHGEGTVDQRPGSCGPQSLRSHLASLFSPQVSLYQTFDKEYECEDGAVHVGTQSQVQWCSRSVGGVRQILNECSDEPHRSQFEAHESSTISIGGHFEEVPREDGQDRQVSTTTSSAKMSSMLSMNVPQLSHLRNSEQQIRMRWLQMLLENTSAVCYLNSGIQILGWGILAQTDALDTWEIIGELMLELLSLTSPCSIHTTETCRNLLQSWPDIHRQHDVAELIGYSLTRLELRKEDLGQWGAIYPEAGWIEYTFPLVQPLPLPLPEDAQAVSLQMLFDTWTIEGSKRLGILSPLPGFFLVQLGRFIVTASGIHKTICQIDGLEAPVRVPVYSVLEGMQLTRYAICGVVVHHGATPDSGHYTCLLREGTQWWLKDDSRAPVLLPALSIEHCRACYVLCLSRIQDGS